MNRTINVGGNQGRGNPPFAPKRAARYSAVWAIFSAALVVVVVTVAKWSQK